MTEHSSAPKHHGGGGGGWIGTLAAPVSALYGMAVARRNKNFDQGKRVTHLDRPVVSVGNLSMGGTGKTPMVVHLLELLVSNEHHPCVAMRGYRAAVAEDGSRMSDEAQVYQSEFADLPVVAQPDRLAGLGDLFATPNGEKIDCIVLDDGFQHRFIARDLDIVLIDATSDPFRDRLLPGGRLREPIGSLCRADAVVLTHSEAVSEQVLRELMEQVRRVNPDVMLACAEHAWTGFDGIEPEAQRTAAVRELGGYEELLAGTVVAVCAIGRPALFIQEVQKRTEAAGGRVAETLVLRDHDPYKPETVRRVIKMAKEHNAAAIVTTAKDWTKLEREASDAWPCPVIRPRLKMVLNQDGEALERVVLEAVGR